jgi:antibiotic biosynthesis monooxygenase (ABM) superfamily enzyme
VTIFRFDSYASLKSWQESEAHREWQERLPVDALEGGAQTSRMTGLETWFTAPGAAAKDGTI